MFKSVALIFDLYSEVVGIMWSKKCANKWYAKVLMTLAITFFSLVMFGSIPFKLIAYPFVAIEHAVKGYPLMFEEYDRLQYESVKKFRDSINISDMFRRV